MRSAPVELTALTAERDSAFLRLDAATRRNLEITETLRGEAAPTLLSLLNMSYDSHFYGRSIFDPAYTNRAFIATYQDLGYLEGDTFTILSPVRRFEQYRVVPTEENPHHLEAMERKDAVQVDRAIGYYQTSCKWNKR